jgi:hypothetical protein
MVSGSQPLTFPTIASGSGSRPGIWLYDLIVLRDRPHLSATSVTDRYFCTSLTVRAQRYVYLWMSPLEHCLRVCARLRFGAWARADHRGWTTARNCWCGSSMSGIN